MYIFSSQIKSTTSSALPFFIKLIQTVSKDDKIDARGLAQMGLEQNLSLWQPFSKNIYAVRILTRQHQRLQELKKQSDNQKHSLLHSQYIDKFVLKQLDKLIKIYEQQILQIAQEVNRVLDENPILKAKIAQLTRIKGIGLLLAATIVAETNGFTGFENIRQLVSFAGYDVIENQSGKRVGKTRISKKGNSRIRRILFMPAFNAGK